MKRTAFLLALLILLCQAVPAPASVSASLNQKMATRSGPGTKYTEELGALPQSTRIVVINCVTTNGTPWCLVEFKKDGQLMRCYTGLKRINTSAALPEGSVDYEKDMVIETTKVYYGPGTNYAERKGSISKGEEMRVFEVEGDWALVEYRHGGKWQRGYIPVSTLKKTVARATPTPTATPAPTPVPTKEPLRDVEFAVWSRDTREAIDYYGNIYDYGNHDDEFIYMAAMLPVMSYFDNVPCVKHTDVYSGPGYDYWRRWLSNGAGYAYTGILDTDLRIYGQENGWILIRYPSDSNSGYRYGWVVPQAVSAANQAKTKPVDFAYLPAITTRANDATDDPDRTLEAAGYDSGSVSVTALAFLDEDRNWVYCEYLLNEGGKRYTARGFIPARAVRLK